MRQILLLLTTLCAGSAAAQTVTLTSDLAYARKIKLDRNYESFERKAQVTTTVELDKTYRIVEVERQETGMEFAVDVTVTAAEPDVYRATYQVSFGYSGDDSQNVTREVSLLLQPNRTSESKLNDEREMMIVKSVVSPSRDGRASVTGKKLKPTLKVHPGVMVPQP